MKFLRDNRLFLAFSIPLVAIPWITIGNFHLLLFNFPHNRFEFGGFAVEMETYALIGTVVTLGLGTTLIAALSLSRFYCGTLCPNTFFAHLFSLVKGKRRRFVTRLIGFILIAVLSSALVFSVVAYGISTAELIIALQTLSSAGWLVIVLSILMIAEVFMIQGWYCAYLCPYGAICAILPIEDRLMYTYTDPEHHCTGCGRCVKICPIPDLDIRAGFDIRCIQCGLCEAVCEKTFAKLPITSLIHLPNRSFLRAGGKSRGIFIAIVMIIILMSGSIFFLSDTNRLDSCRLENRFLY